METDPNEELDFFETEYEFPAMDFSEVGYFVGDNEYELVMVIDGTLKPLDEEGKLTYEAGYYFSNWPLVKKDLWENAKIQPKLRMPTATAHHWKRAQAGVPTNSRTIKTTRHIRFRAMTNGLDMALNNMQNNIKPTR